MKTHADSNVTQPASVVKKHPTLGLWECGWVVWEVRKCGFFPTHTPTPPFRGVGAVVGNHSAACQPQVVKYYNMPTRQNG